MIVVVLAGCAPVELEDRMGESGVEVPATWQSTREGRRGVDRNWLQRTGGRELSGLVTEALAANPDLKASAARLERAAAEARIAGASRQPTFGLGLEGRRSEQKFVGLPFDVGGGGVPGSLSNQFGVALQAAWEVDLWGRLRAGQQAAMADFEAGMADHDAARVSLAAQVAKAWLAVVEANEQVRLADEAAEAWKLLAGAVRERFERALAEDGGSAAQVRLSESEAASSMAALVQREQERDRALRQLELLLGRYPSGRVATARQLPAMPSPVPAGLPSELLLRRPDVLAAERRLAADGGRVKKAQLARFPSLRMTGSMGTTTDSLGDLLRSDFGVWSLGGSLTQPLFEGGRIAGNIDLAKADERAAAADLQRTVLRAFGEVEQALAAEGFLTEREAATKRAFELAREAAERADDEFSAGTGDVLTLIDARQREINTQSQLVAIRRMRLDQRIDLHLALGGDFKL